MTAQQTLTVQEELQKFMQSAYKKLGNLQFNLYEFINDVEIEFEKIGFRNDSDEVPAEEAKNILVVRTDAIGDYILTIPFFRELRKFFSKANIVLVSSPSTYNFTEISPYFDEFYFANGSSMNNPQPTMMAEILDVCYDSLWFKDGKLRRFDYAFSPQWGSDNLIPCLFTYLSGARRRIGYGDDMCSVENFKRKADQSSFYTSKEWRDNFLLTDVPIVESTMHWEVDKHLYLLKHMHFYKDEIKSDLELPLTADDEKKAKMILAPLKREKMIVGIGARNGNARYDAKKLNEVLKRIPNTDFIVIGGISDYKTCVDSITVPHVNLCNKLTLRETAAVIKHSDLYLGNDTGVMHMAEAFKKPSIIISRESINFTNNEKLAVRSSIKRFAPRGIICEIVQPRFQIDSCAYTNFYGGCDKPHPHCILQITPEEIFNAYERLKARIKN